MKLNPEFITHLTDEEALLVPLGGNAFHGIVRGNPTLGAILERLKQETTEEQIVESMCAEYDAPKETIAADVHRVVEQLRGIGAING